MECYPRCPKCNHFFKHDGQYSLTNCHEDDCCFSTRPRLILERKDVRKLLRRGAWSSLSDWLQACQIAKDNGWTFSEVERILWLYHPLTWMIGTLVLVVVGGILIQTLHSIL